MEAVADKVRARRQDRGALRISAASNGLHFGQNYKYTTSSCDPSIGFPKYSSSSHARATSEGSGSSIYRPARSLLSLYTEDEQPSLRQHKKHQTEAPIDLSKRSEAQFLSILKPRNVNSNQGRVSMVDAGLQSKRQLAVPASASANAKRRSSTASIHSINSMTPSFASRKRKYYNCAQLTSMPCEILDEIFLHLDQKSLHAVVSCNRYLAESAATALYASPQFASSYRFAQFVHIVSHNQSLANCVRSLDLSMLAKPVEEDVPLAGWREFKYRSSPLYTIRRGGTSDEMERKARSALTEGGSHPLPSPFLTQYHLSRDVPVGAVLHVIAACRQIRIVNVSSVPLVADYLLLPTATKYSGFRPTSFTKVLYVSDVPKAFTWRPDETKVVSSTRDLVDAICAMPRLTELNIHGGLWIGRDIAMKIVTECGKLLEVDFRDCGVHRTTKWAVKGERETVLNLLIMEIEEELEKKRKAEEAAKAAARRALLSL